MPLLQMRATNVQYIHLSVVGEQPVHGLCDVNVLEKGWVCRCNITEEKLLSPLPQISFKMDVT